MSALLVFLSLCPFAKIIREVNVNEFGNNSSVQEILKSRCVTQRQVRVCNVLSSLLKFLDRNGNSAVK
jgi:hypothetical protein